MTAISSSRHAFDVDGGDPVDSSASGDDCALMDEHSCRPHAAVDQDRACVIDGKAAVSGGPVNPEGNSSADVGAEDMDDLASTELRGPGTL